MKAKCGSRCNSSPTCSSRAISATAKRFKPQVLEDRYRGRSIHQVLRSHRARSADVLQQPRRRSCAGCRCSTRSASATCASVSRRRRCPAARRSESRLPRTSLVAWRRAPALHPRRADDGAALRRHREAAHRVQEAARGRGTRCSSSSTTSTSSRRRTTSSTSAPRAAKTAAGSSPPARPNRSALVEESHTGRYLRPVLAEGRSHAYAAGR